MTNSTLSCLRCQGSMEPGFTVDNTYGGRLVSSWIAGEPVFGSIFGKTLTGLARMKDRKAINTTTYRCTSCGYLESYARP